jgi:hypothetical protein
VGFGLLFIGFKLLFELNDSDFFVGEKVLQLSKLSFVEIFFFCQFSDFFKKIFEVLQLFQQILFANLQLTFDFFDLLSQTQSLLLLSFELGVKFLNF